ncbi:MAG TPA: diacylglycerol kinase family protein [Candidatus Dormibacteraeota bacterium]
MKTVFIVNPASGNATTGRLWDELSGRIRGLGLEHEALMTHAPGDATELAARAIAEGADTVVAVGGDGTINEVANGFFTDGVDTSKAALGVLPMGTGGDFRRTVGIPDEFEAAIRSLSAKNLRQVDAGRIEMRDLEGAPLIRHFVNIADAGIGGVVVERVNRTSKLFGGRVSFQYAAMMTLLSFKPPEVLVESAEDRFEGRAQNVVVANCQYFGGSMHVAPAALPDDGLLDIVVFGDIARFEAIRSINDIYSAKHLQNPKVRGWRSAEVKVTSPERVLIDVDGEMCGTLPATFTVLPLALRLVVP